MIQRSRAAAALAAGLLGVATSSVAFLDGPPTAAELSIARCQRMTTKAVEKLAQAEARALRGCLDPAAQDFYAGQDISDATTLKCLASIRQANDSRGLGKSASEKAKATIAKACEPGPSKAHSLADVLGSPGATVRRPMHAQQLGKTLTGAGGPPDVTTVGEFADAVIASTKTKTAEHLAKSLPNAPKILKRVEEKVAASAAVATDPSRKSDVEAAVQKTRKRIDADENDVPDAEPTMTVLPSCATAWVGDGWCDVNCNDAAHGFDGGDCCPGTCASGRYVCGFVGYACIGTVTTTTTSTTTTTLFAPDVCGNCVWEPGAGEGCDPCSPVAGPGCLPNCTCDLFSVCNFF